MDEWLPGLDFYDRPFTEQVHGEPRGGWPRARASSVVARECWRAFGEQPGQGISVFLKWKGSRFYVAAFPRYGLTSYLFILILKGNKKAL